MMQILDWVHFLPFLVERPEKFTSNRHRDWPRNRITNLSVHLGGND